MAPTVTVVLATHNGERFLDQQLDSLLAQTLQPSQIIISDDASSDGTRAIVETFAARSPVPVRLIHNHPALGFRENFLRASMQASCELVAFCDQDDVWLADKLEHCARCFEDPQVVHVVHQAQLIDEGGRAFGLFGQGIATDALRPPLSYDPWRTFYGFTQVFRRSLLQLVPPAERFIDYEAPPHRIAHDRWVFFLANVLGATVELAEPLVQYRQHGGNLYGAVDARPRDKREDVRARNLVRVQAANAMVRIIETMPEEATRLFPGFDRSAASACYRAALQHVSARESVYEAERLVGLTRLFGSVALGKYRAHTGQHRWRAIAKDLYYCVSR